MKTFLSGILLLLSFPILSQANLQELVMVNASSVLGIERGMSDTLLYSALDQANINERSYNKTDGLHKMYSVQINTIQDYRFDVFSECENNYSCYITKTVLRTPNFITKKGIRVGSTFSDILRKYTNPVITTIDGGIVIVPMEDQNVAFVLEGISLAVQQESYDINDIPQHTRVSCIHVF